MENLCLSPAPRQACSPSRTGALEGGKLRGFHIFCPAHGVRFDMRDGSAMGTLTKLPIKVWEVEIIDGVIYIGMDVA
jgi:nitrite reductase/ring-hydroxylating ferredoxin subunit